MIELEYHVKSLQVVNEIYNNKFINSIQVQSFVDEELGQRQRLITKVRCLSN
jgi:hypothetical protein